MDSVHSSNAMITALYNQSVIEYNNVLFFTTDSVPTLAEDICLMLGVKLSPMTIDYFSNGEVRPIIKISVHGKIIILICTRSMIPGKSVNDDIMALELTMEAMTRAGAKRIILVLPNYPYARQDKKDQPRSAISAAHFANVLVHSGLGVLICVDLHNPSIQGFFPSQIPVDNLYSIAPVVDYIKNIVFTNPLYTIAASSAPFPYGPREYELSAATAPQRFIAISPDEGAFKRTRTYAEALSLPFLCFTKTRDYSQKNTVDDTKTQIFGDVSNLAWRWAIVFDDMCDTFGTVQVAAKKLVEAGAKGVIVLITHGILSGPALERLNRTDEVVELICSDSIPQHENMKSCKKIKTFTLAPLLAEVIRRRLSHQSVSEIFAHS